MIAQPTRGRSGSEKGLNSLILAPLRTGQSTVGVIVLANASECAPYSAANLKLLNTIAPADRNRNKECNALRRNG